MIGDGAITVPPGSDLPPVAERPANADHGDWASVAMQLVARAAPLKIAEVIVDHLGQPPAIADAVAPASSTCALIRLWVAAQVGPVRRRRPGSGAARCVRVASTSSS